MKILIQRVKSGRVSIDGELIDQIAIGYVVLVGVREGDTPDDAMKLALKTVNLRIFPDNTGRMNRSIKEVNGEILAVSQFTLYADTRKGNRPSFIRSGDPNAANLLYEEYVAALRRELGKTRVKTGRFGANMLVNIANDGPVTIELSTDKT